MRSDDLFSKQYRNYVGEEHHMRRDQSNDADETSRLACCFKKCLLNAPQCSRGVRCSEDLAYGERICGAPLCPACHVTCSLFDPQCSRGMVFRQRWQAGEEIPERHMPPRGKPFGEKRDDKQTGERQKGHGAHDKRRGPKSTADKLMFLLTGIVPRMLGDLEGTAEQRVLSGLARQGGAMSRDVIPEKTRISVENVDSAICVLESEELIEPRQSEWGTIYFWVTDAGRNRCKELETKREQGVQERFSALNDEEQEQLAVLLDKLLAAGRRLR